ncbi:bifunctional 2',3'-cyclic-nucleotide 2'-phosphodiesterase/3'-nucleotidase [Aliiroseovarius crassostreae]|uniref:bifunctional 2',3'-cyclic-nucleotide 2'-phosphodiesterase/3'-nucleotidase n=1 Tax=Aliiroseovarius crassostreae TaxID=154981 RepID=UPI0021AF9B9B|nr:bifunctional 2',3'-cyclic-nucleotide 2'-phosphodiesterase/3'-nucleotidase [Aliiroseovarius crassostreae]UWP91691.1 bifunctional 2',3'-cyclic-nucleotide 2'-phosphodiesterase/3'-nucleotidase [Aliiroseovarius crassostreae]
MVERQASVSQNAANVDECSRSLRMKVRFLATTDLHMHILPYDYLNDLPNARWGLAQTAKLIQQARMERRNAVLLDAGDFLHGTAMGDFVVEQARGERARGHLPEVHPMIAAMNHLRYDAATIGNHDFDRGVDVLLSAIEQAEFPIVSANSVLKKGEHPFLDSTFMPPYTILNRRFRDCDGVSHMLRIGVIGFLPPNSIHTGESQPITPGTRDILEAARSFVPRLRAKGVDLVVALAHSGIDMSEPRPGMENAVVPLCEIDGVDVVIGGHSHQCFPPPPGDANPAHNWLHAAHMDLEGGKIHGKPVVVPGFWGSHLGVIDLDLTRSDGRWHICAGRSELREVPESEQDAVGADFSALLGQLHESTLMHVRTRIGYAHQSLHSYFSLVGLDPSTRLVQQAMTDFTRQLISDGEVPDLPVLASSAPFKNGGLGGPGYFTSIQPGELTLRSVSDLYIFPNELALVRASGAYIRDWLERAASVFCQVAPGQARQVLKDVGTPGYLLETILGVTYRIDLSQPARFSTAGRLENPAACRITDLRYQDRLVRDEDEFLLVTSDFRIRGGGGFPIIDPDRIVPVKQVSIRDLVRQYVEQRQNIELEPTLQFTFAPVREASVVFPSSPLGKAQLAEGVPLSLRDLGEEDPRGFSLYELML